MFGVADTLKALELGAVEILIAWENLDIVRYGLKNHSSGGKFPNFTEFENYVHLFEDPIGNFYRSGISEIMISAKIVLLKC